MNDIQIIGSHNSYKLAIDDALKETMEQQRPGSVRGLDYSHIPLSDQLDLGLRILEIDVVYDPEGGLYAAPFGYVQLKKMGKVVSDYDPDSVMKKPGFKVLHVPDVDFRSSCLTFKACLEEVKSWSQEHPNHIPILIMMNAKDSGIEGEGFVKPLDFDSLAFEQWDQEILDVFSKKELIVPDDVRGDFETLEAAVLDHGWPELNKVRGKVFFLIDHTDKKRDIYIRHHPTLKGRVMFVDAEEGMPASSIRVINDPVRNKSRIQELVKKGYLVRTRADADTEEARSGDHSRFEAAKESGAQFISTDYYLPDPRFGTGYQIQLENKFE